MIPNQLIAIAAYHVLLAYISLHAGRGVVMGV